MEEDNNIKKQAEAAAAAIPEERCARCDHPIGQNIVKPCEEDKKEYLRRMLADQPYKKTYPMFDGALTIEFEAMLSNQATLLEALCQDVGRKYPDNPQAQLLKIRAVIHVSSLAGKSLPKYELTEETSAADVLLEWDKRFGERNEDMVVILIRVLMQHMQYMNILAESAFDRNFWKGAGLG